MITNMIPVIRHERGAVLTVVIVMAIVCSMLAWGVLYAAIANARRAQFHREWMPARYAAEAGLVWAMQRLWADPAWSAPGGQDITAILAIPGVNQLIVTYPVCATPPCPLQVTARN